MFETIINKEPQPSLLDYSSSEDDDYSEAEEYFPNRYPPLYKYKHFKISLQRFARHADATEQFYSWLDDACPVQSGR